jgi:hypothetical protein
VYSKLSAASLANPKDATMAAAAQTSFQGTTLRSLLLEGYAFSQFALIALWAAIVSFTLALVMAVLVLFGFRHSRRVPDSVELLAPNTPQQPVAAG